MKFSNFHIRIGNKEVRGIWGAILAILILIPVLALVGFILTAVFSIVGVVLGIAFTLILAVIGVAILVGLISLILPKSWREKLGIYVNFSRTKSKPHKPTTTPDGKPIVDVDFKEEDK